MAASLLLYGSESWVTKNKYFSRYEVLIFCQSYTGLGKTGYKMNELERNEIYQEITKCNNTDRIGEIISIDWRKEFQKWSWNINISGKWNIGQPFKNGF